MLLFFRAVQTKRYVIRCDSLGSTSDQNNLVTFSDRGAFYVVCVVVWLGRRVCFVW